MDATNSKTVGLLPRLKQWLAHPFTNDMDLLSVTLTTGLIVILVFLWTRILGDITAID